MSRLRSKRNEYQYGTVGEALQRFFQTKSMECVVPSYASLSKQLQENISPYQFEVLRETHNKWGMPYQFGDNENMNELFPNLAKPQIRYTAPYMDNPSLANGYNAQPASHLRNDYNELLGIMEKPLSPTVVDTLPQTTLQWQGVGNQWQGVGNRATTGMQANATLQQPNAFGAPTLGLSHSNLATTGSAYKPQYATDTLSVGTYNIGKVSPVALQDEARKAPQAVQEQSQPAVQYNLSPPNEYPYANDGDTYYTSAPTSVGKELTHSITHRGDRYYRSKLFGDTPNYVYLANQNSASSYSPEDLDAYLASFREKRPISLNDPSKFVGYGYIIEETNDTLTDCLDLSKWLLHLHNVDEYGQSDHVFKLMEELWIGEGRTDNDRVLRNYDDGITSIAQNYRNAISCLDEHLEADRPIIVGVNHSKPRKKKGENGVEYISLANEGTTDHFIVVNGRGFDEVLGLPYYTYYEVGTAQSYGYDMKKNRLLYDPINLAFYDSTARLGYRYDVTQVRPNNKNLKGTVNQGNRK